jgi:hypothetical protein
MKPVGGQCDELHWNIPPPLLHMQTHPTSLLSVNKISYNSVPEYYNEYTM